MDQKHLDALYDGKKAEVIDGVQDGIVQVINRRLALGSPVYFGVLGYYPEVPAWKTFGGAKLSLQEEYAMKELFIGLPVYSTFVVVDAIEKDEKGTAKICIGDMVLESLQNNKEFLEYHRRCANKLMRDWRDNVRPKQ